MSTEIIVEAIQGNPQAQKAFEGLMEVNQKNVETIGELEKFKGKHDGIVNELKEDRDRIKSMVRKEMGLDELTEEGFKQKLRTFGESDALTAMEKEFSTFKNDAYNEKQNLANQVEELRNGMVKKDLTHKVMSTGIYGELESDIFGDMFTEWVLDGATLDENGELVYVKNDTTLRNESGAVMSLTDRINEIKNDPKRSKVFIESKVHGSGAPVGGTVTSGRAPSSDGLVRSQMNNEQKKAYVAEFGRDNYNKIPLA